MLDDHESYKKKETHVSLKCFDEQKMIFVVNYIFF